MISRAGATTVHLVHNIRSAHDLTKVRSLVEVHLSHVSHLEIDAPGDVIHSLVELSLRDRPAPRLVSLTLTVSRSKSHYLDIEPSNLGEPILDSIFSGHAPHLERLSLHDLPSLDPVPLLHNLTHFSFSHGYSGSPVRDVVAMGNRDIGLELDPEFEDVEHRTLNRTPVGKER